MDALICDVRRIRWNGLCEPLLHIHAPAEACGDGNTFYADACGGERVIMCGSYQRHHHAQGAVAMGSPAPLE